MVRRGKYSLAVLTFTAVDEFGTMFQHVFSPCWQVTNIPCILVLLTLRAQLGLQGGGDQLVTQDGSQTTFSFIKLSIVI